MHVFVRYQGEGAVILSDTTAKIFCGLLQQKITHQKIRHIAIRRWVDDMCELTYHAPEVAGQLFDITSYFHDNPQSILTLVKLLEECIQDSKKHEHFKGAHTIRALIKTLNEYHNIASIKR